MALTSWLVDKSAYARIQDGRATEPELWLERIDRGLVHVSGITLLELGYSVRSGAEGRRGFASPPVSKMPVEHLTPAQERRALEVQMLLADRGQHRAPSVADLLIAAIAERRGLTVLAKDKDFGLIAEITGQPIEELS